MADSTSGMRELIDKTIHSAPRSIPTSTRIHHSSSEQHYDTRQPRCNWTPTELADNRYDPTISLEERIKGAQFILVATVTKVEDGRKGAHGKVASLAVEALLRGDRRALGETPELIFATGYACDGQTFKAGDKAIFFLTRRKDGFCYRVNWQGGARCLSWSFGITRSRCDPIPNPR